MAETIRPRKLTAVESAAILRNYEGTKLHSILRSHFLWSDQLEDQGSEDLKRVRSLLGRCRPGEEVHCLMLMKESLAELDSDLAEEKRARQASEADRHQLICALQQHRDMLKSGRNPGDVLASIREVLQRVNNESEDD